jgi:hypothetical protein
VARAKRTDRSEARRRHRAQLAAEGRLPSDDTDVADDTTAQPVVDRARGRGPVGGARTATRGNDGGGTLHAPRPAPAGGVRNAFRGAFRPLNLREDLRLLPRLLLHRSFWVPSLIAVVTAAAIVAFQGRELISQFAATYFLAPPPIGGIFLAGFLAPRASYLIGALFGLVSAVIVTIAAASLTTVVPGTGTPAEVASVAFVISPLSGIFFGAAAAWYRRFLYLASPARQLTRRPPPARGKPVRGR